MAKKVAKNKKQKKTAKRPAKKTAPKKANSTAASDGGKVAGMTDAAVRKATGRGWDDWFSLLDKAGAAKMPHKETATLLYEKHGVPGWWCQMVTVGYEQARGLRAANEQSGGFSASASKTIAVPVRALFDACHDPKRRAKWLPDAPLRVTKATRPKSVRIAWGGEGVQGAGFNPKGRSQDGGTRVDVNLWPKGDSKSMIQLQHEKLADAKAVAAAKKFWGQRLEALKAFLEG